MSTEMIRVVATIGVVIVIIIIIWRRKSKSSK
jgi:hypothetical protein